MVRVQVSTGPVTQALPCWSQSPRWVLTLPFLESEQDSGR